MGGYIVDIGMVVLIMYVFLFGGWLGVDEYFVSGCWMYLYIVIDQQEVQFFGQWLLVCGGFCIGGYGDFCFQCGIDCVIGVYWFQYFGDLFVQGQQLIEIGGVQCGIGWQWSQVFVLGGEQYVVFVFVWQVVLQFVGGEVQDWCDLVCECFGDVIYCVLC